MVTCVMPKSLHIAYPIILISFTLLVACGRSGTNPAFTSEKAEEVQNANTTALANQASIEDIESAQGNIVVSLDALRTDVDDNDARIGALEAGGAVGGPFNDDVIRIDDQGAAGFIGQGNIENVELGFSNINERLASQNAFATALDARVSAAENEQAGTLTTAVENIADARIAAAIPLGIQNAIDARIALALGDAIDDAIEAFSLERVVPLESAIANMSGGVILGPSAPTTGDAGGLTGAASLCVAAYPAEVSAHMCTLAEVHHAVSRANAAVDGVEAWILPSMTAIYAAGAYAGQHYDADADSNQMSCNSMTHDAPALTAAAEGVSVEVNGGSVNLKPAKDCSLSLPLLCCL